MTLIDTLRPEHRRWLRRLRKRIANRENMRICTRSGTRTAAMTSNRGTRLREVSFSGPDHRIGAGYGVPRPRSHPADAQHRPSDPVEDDIAAGASDDDTRDHLLAVVPTLDELTALGDPCLRW